MGSRATGVTRRRLTRPSEPAVAEAGPWGITALAWVVSALCRRPVGAEGVRDRAVGLGLFRLPAAGEAALLTAMAVSRLFLAGYGLPAAAERGTVAALQDHHRAGRRLFIALDEGQDRAAETAFEVHGFVAGLGDEVIVLEGEAGVRRPARDSFSVSWEGGGNRLIVAARGWNDLPADGADFFAGYRSPDGTYHWNTAECDTDHQGRVLRY